MIKVHLPIEKIEKIKNGVFLAGPCPRDPALPDWRDDFIKKLEGTNFNGEIIDPTNRNYDTLDPTYYDKQCQWETDGMHIASIIVFWVDRTEKNPAFTTNIEFGIWSNAMTKRLVVGIPEGSPKCGYIKWVCEKKGIPCYSTMDEVIAKVNSILHADSKVYFTSDTHFSSDRHLLLSRRPYLSVHDMDYEFISNWNKVATCNDIIYHLGDFGNPEILNLLNFKELVILEGNYEHKDATNVEALKSYDGVTVNNDLINYIMIDDGTIGLVHEPIAVERIKIPDDVKFFLFGHIHEKGKVKRNGYNVGIDANNYNLVDADDIAFYYNAIRNHYDENVFTDRIIY